MLLLSGLERASYALDYRFDVLVDWIPAVTEAAVGEALAAARRDHPRRQVRTLAPVVLPQRLWESLVDGAALPDGRIRC
ncbi:MAG: hypothetical protein IPI34_15200 [bacterium]|nr:hypothetical protein [bacterium]